MVSKIRPSAAWSLLRRSPIGPALLVALAAACGADPVAAAGDAGDVSAGDASAAGDAAGSGDASSDTDTGAPVLSTGAPDGTGPYAIERVEQEIPTSIKSVRTVFYLPQDAPSAPYPVVMFHHGFTLRAENFEGYGQRLASHGFAVLLPSMDDGLTSALTHAELRDIQVELVDWIEDAAVTAGSPLFGVADAGRIGVAGHSRGGKQAMLGAVSDDRLRAVLGVDPVDAAPPFGGEAQDYPSVAPELMPALAVPSGYIGAGRGAEAGMGGQACAPEGENYAAYFAASPSPSFAWTLGEAGHNDFVESCEVFCAAACPRWETPELALGFAQTTAVAFFKVFLADEPGYRPWLDGDRLPEWVSLEQR